MQLESQMVSLELSKKLKELGVKQESLWKWFYGGIDTPGIIPTGKVTNQAFDDWKCPAYTVAELGEILGKPMRDVWISYEVGMCGAIAFLFKRGTTELIKEITGDTEANARAKMLIYLLENKLTNHELLCK